MKMSEAVSVTAALTSWDTLHPQGREIIPGGQFLGHHNPLNRRENKTQEHLSRVELQVGRKLSPSLMDWLMDDCDFLGG